MLSPSVRSLVFETKRGEAFDFEPGHVMDLMVPVPRGIAMKRPYSIASARGFAGPSQLEFAVTRVENGPTSTALHALELHAVVDAEGPRGSFLRWPAERDLPTLFVATGSGLAPLRAMLQADLAREHGPKLALLFGCRTSVDVLWRDELAGWAESKPRFTLDVTLSRPEASWSGRTGYVQRHLAECLARTAPARVFVCGLSAMTDDVLRALQGLGVPPGAIRSEAYDE
jgi:CDP-4-dehydro-6-deoxyglucose reductase